MKKTAYYSAQFGRKNIFKQFFLNLAYSFASLARMPLEIFTRKNFGERYFSFAQIIFLLVILGFIPVAYIKSQNYGFGEMGVGTIILKFTTWYSFLVAVFVYSLKRQEEVKRLPSVFDFARFSLSTGQLNPAIRGLKINGKTQDIRTVEILIEPAVFLALGLVLTILAQPIGYLITVFSILYSLSYVMAYHIGDNFIMDLIDNMICAEELADTFVNDAASDETRGFQTYGRKPQDPEMRRKVADAMAENEEPVFAV